MESRKNLRRGQGERERSMVTIEEADGRAADARRDTCTPAAQPWRTCHHLRVPISLLITDSFLNKLVGMVVAWGCNFFARALQRLVILCCEAMVWSVTFLAFPIRMLSAVERERKLGRLIAEMQEQMDGLVWENKDLEERLQAALKEQDALEAVLDEMEEEHEDAFARIDVLETQLKQENMRLNEHKGKARWDKATPEDDGKSNNELGRKSSCLTLTTPLTEDALARQAKVVARRRSLFSLGMSLAVGAVAWSADAPCLPLLAGLFAVVGVSMRSVLRSCDALRRGGPAADAVALLSLNWFLLGVLTSPMLPGVVWAVVSGALGPALTWFAATAPL